MCQKTYTIFRSRNHLLWRWFFKFSESHLFFIPKVWGSLYYASSILKERCIKTMYNSYMILVKNLGIGGWRVKGFMGGSKMLAKKLKIGTFAQILRGVWCSLHAPPLPGSCVMLIKPTWSLFLMTYLSSLLALNGQV